MVAITIILAFDTPSLKRSCPFSTSVRFPSVDTWQGRASVRAQSLDYLPLVGKMQDHEEIYTLAGLGSKGFMFAPLCSEILAALILGELCPVSQKLLDKLNPQRFKKKNKVKKPYDMQSLLRK